MPSPRGKDGHKVLDLFGQIPSALAPKGTRLSLKMPAAFPKVNRRMRRRERKTNLQTKKQTCGKNPGIPNHKKEHNADQREVFHAAKGSISCNRRLYFMPRRGISFHSPENVPKKGHPLCYNNQGHPILPK